MKNTIKDSDLRSIGVQNLLDKNPQWFILKGNFIISFVLLVLLSIICYSVKYPEFINSKININPTKVSNHNHVIVGELTLSKNNDLAKIKNGQKVIVKLYDYPYQEYGVLKGIVQNKILIDSINYHIDVTFPNGLKTSHNKIIPSKLLKGNAEIIIQDYRLIEKLYPKF